MRIRPFFWFLLLVSCSSVLTVAVFYHHSTPGIVQVNVDQHPLISTRVTMLEIRLTDPQGLPINEAHVLPSAHMTNMQMIAKNSRVIPAGHGTYNVHVHLSMAGPWAITIQAYADGFDTLQRTVLVQVT